MHRALSHCALLVATILFFTALPAATAGDLSLFLVLLALSLSTVFYSTLLYSTLLSLSVCLCLSVSQSVSISNCTPLINTHQTFFQKQQHHHQNHNETSDPVAYTPYTAHYGSASDTTAPYRGCYSDEIKTVKRALPYVQEISKELTVAKCLAICREQGFRWAGLEYGSECYCGRQEPALGRLPEAKCDVACAGDETEKCGGALALSVYEHLGTTREGVDAAAGGVRCVMGCAVLCCVIGCACVCCKCGVLGGDV